MRPRSRRLVDVLCRDCGVIGTADTMQRARRALEKHKIRQHKPEETEPFELTISTAVDLRLANEMGAALIGMALAKSDMLGVSSTITDLLVEALNALKVKPVGAARPVGSCVECGEDVPLPIGSMYEPVFLRCKGCRAKRKGAA